MTPEERKNAIRVLRLVRDSKMHRTLEGGSPDYLANISEISALLRKNQIGSLGKCRRDYILTPNGAKLLEQLEREARAYGEEI